MAMLKKLFKKLFKKEENIHENFIIHLCKGNYGSIEFFDDGTYKAYDVNKGDDELKEKKERRNFISKLTKFEIR